MNRRTTFAEEFAVIPVLAKIIALFVYCGGVVGLFLLLTRNPNDPPWSVDFKALFSALVPIPLSVYVLAVGYVNGDARRRNMRYVLWTLLAIFVPNMIGILLYFLLRDPMPAYCSRCGAPVRPGFAHCPRCGTQLSPSCVKCSRPVEPDWSNCPYCGTKL